MITVPFSRPRSDTAQDLDICLYLLLSVFLLLPFPAIVMHVLPVVQHGCVLIKLLFNLSMSTSTTATSRANNGVHGGGSCAEQPVIGVLVA